MTAREVAVETNCKEYKMKCYEGVCTSKDFERKSEGKKFDFSRRLSKFLMIELKVLLR